MKRRWLIVLSILLSVHANAATVVCSGTVAELSYHASDKLMIRLSSMNTVVYICNPGAEWIVSGTSYKTSPDTCKALYSVFLAARLSGEPINSVYFDGDDVPATCNSWGNWKSANIRHFRF